MPRRAALPFLFATLITLVHVTLMERAALHHTGGAWVYPIDDAFIHLALARHIAFDGVYGVTAHGFTAASSSIVWPFLLAASMKVVGNLVTIPFVLNAIAAVALLAIVARGLDREAPSLSGPARAAVLAAVVILVPLATLVVMGMEHVLHAALTIAFVLEAARVVSGESKREWPLAVLAAALASARYEAVFPIGFAVLALAARRRLPAAAKVAALGAAPIVAFGLWAKAHGGLFLPNSVALKGQHFHGLGDLADTLSDNFADRLTYSAYLLPLAFGTLALFVHEARRRGPWTKDAVRLGLAFLTTLAHIELASLAWFYRYEAYLVALDVTMIGIALAGTTPRFAFGEAWKRGPLPFVAGVIAAVVAVTPLAHRALDAQRFTPVACRNIFQQQVQTARFLAREFADVPVAINDIGAPAYYRDGPIVDLVGLASLDVAKAKDLELEKRLTRAQMAAFTKDAPVAILYDEWFPFIPPSWVRLGRLRIDANRVCASNAVAIYATSGEAVPRVLAALRDFAPSLPVEVRREGRFVESPPDPPGAWRADTGDVLHVDFSGAPDLSSLAYVGDDGSFYLPKIGEVKARGKSLAEIVQATRAKAEDPAEPVPHGLDAEVRLVEERRCRVQVSGSVLRPIDELAPCGQTAADVLARVGVQEAGGAIDRPIDPYLWREESGALRRIDFDYDPKNDAAARAMVLKPGDVIIVP
jgi:protein involved in polysaccharide export with SLBB domain